MPGNLSDPTTKGDLLLLEKLIERDTERKLAAMKKELLAEMKRYMKTLSAHTLQIVGACGPDELALITKTLSDHEKRLRGIESAAPSARRHPPALPTTVSRGILPGAVCRGSSFSTRRRRRSSRALKTSPRARA